MAQMQPVRGTHDILGEDSLKHRHVYDSFVQSCKAYGFQEIETPIFEFATVFDRTLGDTSDIVSKEMYTFEDRGGDRLSLRPEGTAGVVRAFLSNGLQRSLPLKLFYMGPMFRYERPQKGRYRQFHQIGVEVLGIENTLVDAEVICLGQRLLANLGIQDLCTLEINSIGDTESRSAYREKLVSYYEKYESDLSEDSKRRLRTNPLRILDSKDAADIKINASAPQLLQSLNADSRNRFDALQSFLQAAGVVFQVNERLVRGLDYYCHAVFEFKTTALGAQDAVLSGGRYDQLVQTMGGPATAGVGFAAGVERLALLLKDAATAVKPVVFVPLSPSAEPVALALSEELRSQGVVCDFVYSGNFSNRMKKAAKLSPRYGVLIGDDELQKQSVLLKDFSSGEQKPVQTKDLAATLKALLSATESKA